MQKKQFPDGVYCRKNKLWISYYDENGRRIRESAKTSDPEIAKAFRDRRLREVAEGRLSPIRRFESITFGEILDFWWERHGKTKRGFHYKIHRLEKFRNIKARKLLPEMIDDFLKELLEVEKYSPSYVNHYRTIFNSAFNFAIKWKKYDENPVSVIPQLPEREARDRFVEVSELAALIGKCQEEKDLELQAFIILAACTGLRKTAILSRRWEEVKLDAEFPSIFLPKKDSKNRRSNRLPLPQFCVEALKQLPSYGKHEYLFPARPNIKYRNVEKFQKPHAWDIGKRFRRIRDLAEIKDLRIHDLRHFATTMLFIEGVSDAIIRKMTGHRSEELERYKHLSPEFSQKTTELIAGKLVDALENNNSGTFWSHPGKKEKTAPKGGWNNIDIKAINGGADGTRTRDLQRDRAKIRLLNFA
jgi:integrase